MAKRGRPSHEQLDQLAEERKERRERTGEVERLDPWGRDADWHYPRDLAPRGA